MPAICVVAESAGETLDSRSQGAVAKRLRITRRALDKSQAQICREAGISFGSWNNAETGNSQFSKTQAVKLYEAFGVDMTWVYMGNTTLLPDYIRSKIQALADDDPSILYKRS